MRRLLVLPVLVLLVLLVPDLATASPAVRTSTSPYGWPLGGTPVVDRGFEPPHTAWGAGHRGVDLRAALGTPVLAAGAGRVAYAGLLAGRGVVVVVHPGGLRTTYEPVAAAVAVGDVVARGDVLGTLGEGHASCRPGLTCLHWGLLQGDTYLDPLALLFLGQVRLLPLHRADRALVATSGRPRLARTAGTAGAHPPAPASPGGAPSAVPAGVRVLAEASAVGGAGAAAALLRRRRTG